MGSDSPPALAYALLSDGRTIGIRPAVPADRASVRAFYDALSEESRRLRFLASGRLPGQQAADRICRSGTDGLALLALHGEQLAGVAEYDTNPDLVSAEVALAVADDFQHRGVGTLLLEHLVAAARERGIGSFTADALTRNRAVLQVFNDLGLPWERRFEGPEVRCRVDLTSGEQYLQGIDARGRTADVASLRPLLQPSCVAVVGAGRSPGSVGRAVLRNLRRCGFPGTLYAVNPHARRIEQMACHASVSALPSTPELAILAVPARIVPETARQCGRAGVRAVTVVSSGLDTGAKTALLAECRAHDMRLVGPNCLGIANTADTVQMNATFARQQPAAGTAGVAVQSGGIGIAMLSALERLGIGVSTFVSLGDKLDVSSNDLLQWWEEDERTDIALLHLESFGNPRAFSRTARRVTRRMPVLTVDAGRSEEGRRAAAGHTAAAATPTVSRRALFRQAGVTAVGSLGDLFGAAALMHCRPRPDGPAVAIVSNAGGTGVLAADACADAGLHLPEPPGEVADRLRRRLPAGAFVGNPVDTTAAVGAESLAACLDVLASWGGADTVMVSLVPTATGAALGDDPLQGVTDAQEPGSEDGRDGPGTAVVVVLPDQPERVTMLHTADGRTVAAYADPQDAARATAHGADRARWLARPAGEVPEYRETATHRARALVEGFLAGHPEGGWLDPRRCAALLDHYGVPRLPQAWAADAQAAAAEAARLVPPGERLALKAHGPGLVHKSDRGGVLLDLAGPEEVRGAYAGLAERLGPVMSGAVVQPMARRGVELLAGVVQDEVFGPLVLFGLGGTATQVLGDHAARLAPLTDVDVEELLSEPRCAALLRGQHGAPPLDRHGVARVLHLLSQLADDLPDVAEAEVNPLLARPDGVLSVDCRVRLRPRGERHGPPWPGAHPRRLR